jgi:hypothetical protein
MADVKISQLTAKAAKVESTDRIPIADYNGSTYDTKYVTGAEINELKLDTSPQLGGNLDVNGNTITSASNGNIQIRPNGTGAVLIGDSSGSNAAPLRFMELSDNGTNYVGLRAADSLTANTTYTLPTADGTSGQVLSTNGTGTLSWTNNDSGLTVNSTAITSGTAGRVFFQNASNQLSQSSNLFWDNTNSRLSIGQGNAPLARLDIRAQGILSTDIVFRIRNSSDSGNLLTFQGDGNVAIGLASTTFKLEVDGNGRFNGNLTSIGQVIAQTSTNSGRMSLLNLRNTGGAYTSALNSSMALAFTNRDSTNVWSDDFIELKVYNNGSTTSTTGYNFYTHNNQSFSSSSVLAMSINGQSVGIGIETPSASAILDVTSTTKGFLPPRMTNAQMVAIATPASGLVVYDTTNNKLCCYDGTSWQNLF